DEPGRDRTQEISPLSGAQVGSDEIELGIIALTAGAVAYQQYQHEVALDCAPGEIRESPANVLACRFPHTFAFVLAEHEEMIAWIPERLAEGVDEGGSPALVLLSIWSTA